MDNSLKSNRPCSAIEGSDDNRSPQFTSLTVMIASSAEAHVRMMVKEKAFGFCTSDAPLLLPYESAKDASFSHFLGYVRKKIRSSIR